MGPAGGTGAVACAVREQQMLDAAVQMFSENGYHETSMDIAAQAQISKPMLYIYYGSKEELFGACLNRELGRFIDAVRADLNFKGERDLSRARANCCGTPSIWRCTTSTPTGRPGSCPTPRPPVRRPSPTPSGRAAAGSSIWSPGC